MLYLISGYGFIEKWNWRLNNMHYRDFRFKNYTPEEIKPEEIVYVYFGRWTGEVEVKPINVAKVTAKTIFYDKTNYGSSRLLFSDIGYVTNNRVYLPKQDVPEALEKFKEVTVTFYEEQLKDIEEDIKTIKNLKLKEEN
jgi:hypothetical protein